MQQRQAIAEKIGTFAIDREVACVVLRSDKQSHREQIEALPKTPAADPRNDPAYGFNWGGFLLPAIWGFFNGIPKVFALLLAIPPLSIGASIWLGLYGNKLAWEAAEYEETHHFHEVQKAWASLGFISYGIIGAGFALLAVLGMFSGTPSTPGTQDAATSYSPALVSTLPVVDTRLNALPVSTSKPGFTMQLPRDWSTANITDTGIAAVPTAEAFKDSEAQVAVILVDNTLDGALANLKQEAAASHGQLLGEKQFERNGLAITLYIYKYTSGSGTEYRQLLAATNGRRTLVAKTFTKEADWPMLEAPLEKALLSIQLD